MTDESPPVPDDVLTSVTDRLEDEELSLADNEELLKALSDLAPLYERERSYFVLGNYDPEQRRRLELVVDRLERREDTYAFLMSDVRGGWDNGIQKFCLLADMVTHVVGVAEREPSGFLVEQGLLVGSEEYFDKSHVLKRTYPDADEDHPYGWMEDAVFELLEAEDRLYEWRTEDDLLDAVERIP
ncbi:hypothetical protein CHINAEXTREME_17750 [Halobiforma lacisalsi AJ5]|uniref:Uncharacterized protein n=1 Tax=Natronobacterium lacisalsi AJ5 TaxID=358396 RepID=M0LET9_NATLA|nr:hypothetical protein [Halobiforma lacisalsi]APW99497.1 hypothetical protein CHINAEXTREME_17750 [Halobiforma lacisalsi AJ5]EMA31618.1 hypothetical protein C445_14087 [Halobiforma lacisalsi AJ5]